MPCTYFPREQQKKKGFKKWLNHSDTFAKGSYNEGAKMPFLPKGNQPVTDRNARMMATSGAATL